MENRNNFSAEELQKCPYHQMLSAQENEGENQNENTGDWGDIDESDQDGTSPKRNEKNSGNPSDAGSGRNTNT
ncbi:hypothetical protein [Flavobacterium nitrogenifigens]|uniref:Uncharacterized protein n=1 Tax=Flavobacterium nitrogenifigens TaxID=1617283 RepID=A0A521B3H9_9FLAO|nr:hypothetical protein [Flavobacterium nitrogenifigens]KAF2334597.1 hypothetical protein DM397_07955 [Flavobacterium nitrogenifigens]SMO41677.1 hypothetical protein SAMN06265220_101647 [Flavobacterium nitrogenifigens]